MESTHRSNSKQAVQQRREQRRRALDTELRRIVGLLAERDDIVAVIVFGSVARNECGERSDLDLVVVQHTDRAFTDRVEEVYQLVLPRVDVDVLVYTPEEFEELKRDRPFGRRLAAEGRVVYEAAA